MEAAISHLTLPGLARHLTDARDFVEIATIVCREGKHVLGLHQVAVIQLAPDGRPLIAVDNMAAGNDATRLAYFESLWKQDPFLTALRDRHLALGAELVPDAEWMQRAREQGYQGEDVYTLTVPIVAVTGLVGIIRVGSLTPYTDALRQSLSVLGTQVSVRLAQLGAATPVAASGLGRLTARQIEVAQEAARGRSNREIAALLELSENGVKKHLKGVFARLGVTNRTQLAAILVRVAARDKLAPGVTHTRGVVIMKAAGW